MKIGNNNLRRIVSGLFLGAALLMLIFGLTIFSKRLTGVNFAAYWLICFLFTGLAAITALIDVMLLRRKLRDEQSELIESTLEHAQSEQPQKPAPKK